MSEKSDVSRLEHYTASAIQPVEYIVANGLGFFEANILKYITRYRRKNGIEDLKKARVYLDWLIEFTETGKVTIER